MQVTYTTTNIGLESGLVAEGIKKAFDAAAILGMLYNICCICIYM